MEKEFQGKKITENITLCADGKYRWRYDLSLYKNPIVFLLVWKILFCIFLCIFAFVILVDMKNWGFTQERLIYNLKFLGYFFVGMTAVSAIGYLIYAAIMGGKYCVEFEIDENGIKHKQITDQAKKAKKLAKTTAIAGSFSGSLTTVGLGINSSRTEMYTEFASVKRVKVYPRRNLIKVNGRLSHNQVYAAKEDFEFVKNYILTHCKNTK